MNPSRLLLLLLTVACCGAGCTTLPSSSTATGSAAGRTRAGHAPVDDRSPARIAVLDANQGEGPAQDGVRVAALRVIELFPKDNALPDAPRIGYANGISACGVMGTVPVDAEGSAFFELPPGIAVDIQALDHRGRALHMLRSAIRLRPGERLVMGSDDKPGGNATPAPLALLKPPARLEPESNGSYPLTFARLVQPVLDRHCIGCHDGRSGRPDLRPRLFEPGNIEDVPRSQRLCGIETLNDGWTCSYLDLREHAAKLMQMLDCGHGGALLPEDDRHRIALWLDCNCPFYGAYHDADLQARGRLVPPTRGYLPEFEN